MSILEEEEPEELTSVCRGGEVPPASQREKSSMRDRSKVPERSRRGLLRSSSLSAQLKSPPTTTGIVHCNRGASLVKRETLPATLVGPYTLITLSGEPLGLQIGDEDSATLHNVMGCYFNKGVFDQGANPISSGDVRA